MKEKQKMANERSLNPPTWKSAWKASSNIITKGWVDKTSAWMEEKKFGGPPPVPMIITEETVVEDGVVEYALSKGIKIIVDKRMPTLNCDYKLANIYMRKVKP